jgi:hypothetical protein
VVTDKHEESMPDIDGLVENLARQHAPDVLAAALREARRRAHTELTRRLTHAILDLARDTESAPATEGDRDSPPDGPPTALPQALAAPAADLAPSWPPEQALPDAASALPDAALVGVSASALPDAASAGVSASALPDAASAGVSASAVSDAASAGVSALTVRTIAQLGADRVPERGVYAYLVTWEGALDAAALRTAGGNVDLRVVNHAGLGLVVADVDPARYAALGAQAGDDQPLTEDSELVVLARQHDEVVRLVFAQRPVLPLRFGTVLPDEDAAVRLLDAYAEAARVWLERIQGHREWGVRARPIGGPPGANPDPTQGSLGDPAGNEYLTVRRERTTATPSRQRPGVRSTRSLHETLTRYATDSVVRGHHHDHDLLLDAAYLLPVDREKAFQAAVEQLLVDLNRDGVHVEVTGPWPPYSFTQLQWDLDEQRMEVAHR